LNPIDEPTMTSPSSRDRSHARPFLPPRDLARKLGVTVGCLRSWDRKGAPRYVQLALCALIAWIEPKAVERSPKLAPQNPKAHRPAE
jgi:hypothetical protein